MPKKNHRFFFGIFNYQNPQISAIFSFRFMPNLNGGLFSANAGGYMRKFVLIYTILSGIISGYDAYSETLQVAVPLDKTNCSVNQDITMNVTPEWGVDCPNINGGGSIIIGQPSVVKSTISILGLGMCAGTAAVSVGTVESNISTTTAGDNTFCWCRMYSPWLSKWVFARNYIGNEQQCNIKCHSYCANTFISNSTFRDAITDFISNVVSL